MNDPLPIDLFMTKAVEYLLVIGFLAALLLFWRLLARRPAPLQTPLPAGPSATTPAGWFTLPLERFFHPGHGWARPDADGLVALGVDDFAQKLVGKADAVVLPQPGQRIRQGQPLSRFRVGDRAVDLQAPLDGEVVSTNDAVRQDPSLLNTDPYGEGWLVRVRPDRWEANTEELMQGRTAQSFLAAAEDTLQRRMSPSFGLLLQDGGVPVSGLARVLAGDDWDQFARDFLEP